MRARATISSGSVRRRVARFNASAVSGGTSRSCAIASVSSRPPVPSTRTKRGTPPSCTAIAVTPPPNDTMPSAPTPSSASAIAAAGRRRRQARERHRASQRADERERDEVDGRDLQPAGLDRGHEPHAPSLPAPPRAAPASSARRRRRDATGRSPRIAKSSTASSIGIGMSSRGLELQRARELLARHHRHLDLAHDDSRARDADAHRGLLQADLGAQPGDGVGDGGVVGDLAFAHRLARQRDLGEHVEARRCARAYLRDRHRVGADVETDQAAGHASPPRRAVLGLEVRSVEDRVVTRIRKCLPTRIAGSAPDRMRRYTVMVDTRMASATSRTVRRRCSLVHGQSPPVGPNEVQRQQSSTAASVCNARLSRRRGERDVERCSAQRRAS